MSAHWALCGDAAMPVSTADTKRYMVMKRSPKGNRQWLNKEGKYVLLRVYAARFSATEAAERLTDNAVMEVAP
jgi:hypothetical protein